MKSIRILVVLLSIGLLAVGCSQEPDMTAPEAQTQIIYNFDKNGQETLGPPSIDIATGSGFAQGGVGMVDKDMGILDIDVPAGEIKQVLLYWSGGTTGAPGDDTVSLNGNPVTGEMIHDNRINFFSASGVRYYFTAFRADITAQDWVTNGPNSFEITEFDFDFTGGPLDENNGIGMLVIYDDGTKAEISVVDGLDMAFFRFVEPMDATVPQTFTFAAEDAPRMAKMVIFSGSVGVGRPNGIKITTSAGDNLRSDLLGSMDDLLWDSLCLEDVLIPAGDTSLTVELISTASSDPLGASLGWVASGLSVPVNPPPELACLGDYVWEDLNMDGMQDDGEPGIEGVVVHLMDCQGNTLNTMMTDADGYYMFCELDAGDYNVHFELPAGYVFSPLNMGNDPALDSDADPSTGMAVCTTLDPGENDITWDAGMFMPAPELACIGDYVWYDMNMDGIQDQDEMGIEGVVVTLMDCEGNTVGTMMTDADGYYMFCELDAGDYNVHFELPYGYVFSPMNMGTDPALDSDADMYTGMTACTTLDPGENDITWDAGMYMPEEDCEECEGKVTELTLQYNGTSTATIVVEQKKPNVEVFNGTVSPGEMFTFIGMDKKGTLSTEIKIFVDGVQNTKIHTSCSQPIGPGLISGDFEVISGYSREGGLLCPVDSPPPGDDDCECDGKVTTLTMQYNGSEGAQIVVEQKKDHVVVFDDYVMPGDEFSFVGEDKKGTLGTEIKIFVDGKENAKIHTSCSQPIGPGLVKGDFLVMAGASRNNGPLCPLD